VKHKCVMCLAVKVQPAIIPPGAKFLCEKCYKKVQKEIKKRDLGWGIRLKKEKAN
jgi:hypothetical protein